MRREWRDAINDTTIGTATVLFGVLAVGFAMNTDTAARLWRIPVVGAVLQSMTGALNHVYDRTSE